MLRFLISIMASFDGVVLPLVKQDFLATHFVGLDIHVVDAERLQISAGSFHCLQALCQRRNRGRHSRCRGTQIAAPTWCYGRRSNDQARQEQA